MNDTEEEGPEQDPEDVPDEDDEMDFASVKLRAQFMDCDGAGDAISDEAEDIALDERYELGFVVNENTGYVHYAEECGLDEYWAGKAVLCSMQDGVAVRPLCHKSIQEGSREYNVPEGAFVCITCYLMQD